MRRRRSTSRTLGLLPALLLAGALTLAGCGDDGPEGPGTLDGRVTSAASSLGAVVLVVEGSGVEAISGRGDTRAFEGPVQAGSRRVALVGSGSGELAFEIDVQDLAAARPTITVESAVDSSNLQVTALAGIDVRLSAR